MKQKILGYKTNDGALISAFIAQGLIPGVLFQVLDAGKDTYLLDVDGRQIALRHTEFTGIECDQ